jgi:uncharacterized lipoprotein YddW (UPF0748 family)
VAHRSLAVLLLAVLAVPVRAQVVVVTGADPAAMRSEALLTLAGTSYRKVAPAAIDPAALAGTNVVVLIHAPLTPAASAALLSYASAGGKLVLIGQEGPPELFHTVGVEAAPLAHPVPGDRITRADSTELPPGLPAVIADESASAFSVSCLPGTKILAYRTMEGSTEATAGPPAVTLAAGGAVISGLFAPGGRLEKSWLLQAVLAAVDPDLAGKAARGLRRQAQEALAAAVEHWSRARLALPARDAEERLRALQALRSEGQEFSAGGAVPAREMEKAPALQEQIQRVRAFDMSLATSAPAEIRGVWIHTYAPTDWDRVARRVRAAGLNCLVVRVGRGGNVIYPSAFLPRDAWAEKAGGDEMQRAIDAAHRHGLRFIAWRVNFHMGSAPKAYRDRMAAEDRLVRDSHGVPVNWANPGDPRNTELEFQVMREMVEKYDVDGVQFDYIRYPDAPSFDYDYGPVSRREFERKRGRPVADWPAEVLSGPLKTEYEDWERENINRLVERVYREVKRLKPNVLVSAAVWRNHRRYRALLKQDWPLWVKNGWLDLVVPMDYTPEPDTFAATVDAQVALTRGRAPLAAGIGSWLLQTPEELVRQVEIAREAGAAGFVLFAYNAEQIEEQLSGLHTGATSSDAGFPLPAPPVRLSLVSPAIARKDAPLSVRVGAPLALRVVPAGGRSGLGPTAGDMPDRAPPGSPPPSWQAALETPEGELIQVLTRSGSDAQPILTGRAPAGRFQPVLRGEIGADEVKRPFVIRGPLVEGLPPAEIDALHAEERPPSFTTSGAMDSLSGPRIGVYAGSLGAETVIRALSKQRLRVAPLYRLRADHLAAVDTLILPQLADVAELDPATQTRLRRWVEGGHTLILTHDAIGARWHPRLFPELIRELELVPATTLISTQALGEFPRGARFHHRGSDQFRITPGPAATVLVRENPGVGNGPSAALSAPVVVAGHIGRGTVLLIGFLSGYQQTALDDEEARWLAALAASHLPSAPPTGRPPPATR